MEETNIMNINECIIIMKNNVKDKIAQNYLSVLDDCIEEFGTYGLAVQLSYVMCNVSTWKGNQAKEVKAFVRKWTKERIGEKNAKSIAMG